MKSKVEQALRDALETAEDNRKWMSESVARLREENGDPKKLAQYEKWLAEQVETSVQIREALDAPSEREPQ